MIISKRIKEERKAKNYSLRDLADKTNFSHSTIKSLENGETKI